MASEKREITTRAGNSIATAAQRAHAFTVQSGLCKTPAELAALRETLSPSNREELRNVDRMLREAQKGVLASRRDLLVSRFAEAESAALDLGDEGVDLFRGVRAFRRKHELMV